MGNSSSAPVAPATPSATSSSSPPPECPMHAGQGSAPPPPPSAAPKLSATTPSECPVKHDKDKLDQWVSECPSNPDAVMYTGDYDPLNMMPPPNQVRTDRCPLLVADNDVMFLCSSVQPPTSPSCSPPTGRSPPSPRPAAATERRGCIPPSRCSGTPCSGRGGGGRTMTSRRIPWRPSSGYTTPTTRRRGRR